MNEVVGAAVAASVCWLDDAQGTGPLSRTIRILKVSEEAGEVAAAWIGATGLNPRKGVTHDERDVADELADVAFTALVAIASLGFDAEQVMSDCAAKVLQRIEALPEPVIQPS